MNRPLCPQVPSLPKMPRKIMQWLWLLTGGCDVNAAPHVCPRLCFIQILSRPALGSPLFSHPFFSFDLLSNAAESFAPTRRRRQVPEAPQTERERIKFAVPANGS